MYQNPIYMCISWCTKICWFPMKKCWCQQNSRDVSRDSCIFWIFLRWGITVPSFIIVGCVWPFYTPPPAIREQPQKSPSWIVFIGLFLVTCLTHTQQNNSDMSEVSKREKIGSILTCQKLAKWISSLNCSSAK